jgi:MFS family permease
MEKTKAFLQQYPGQFWLMFFGMLLSTVGTSMIWPFLMIYVSEKLDQPLVAVASLLSFNSFVSLGAAFIAGPITDRFGRKWVLVISLTGNGLVYLLLGQATTLVHFAVLMAFWGLFSPLYRVGGDAMLADLVPPEQRADAFALLRMSNNVGVAVGPAVGGFIASTSYHIAFICAAMGLVSYGLLLTFFARETLPEDAKNKPKPRHPFEGYGAVLTDRRFLTATAGFTLTLMSVIPIWVLLSVYAKTNYNVPESQFGLIATTNAVMVILFQFAVTQRTKRYPPLAVMASAAAIYALATFSVSLANGFWGFWLCIVVMTIGELMLVPTSSTFAANLAPVDMRGRYMSIYGLSWGIASGIASPMGGLLNDLISPQAIWYGGALMGLLGMTVFLRLRRRTSDSETLVNLGG